MKFTKIGPNKVLSENGFTFWMQNPFQLHYFEASHEIIVPGEILSGETELLVSLSTIKQWRNPYNSEEISKEHKEKIKNNIRDALKFMEIRAEFD